MSLMSCPFQSVQHQNSPRTSYRKRKDLDFPLFSCGTWPSAAEALDGDVNVFAHLVAPLQSRSDHYRVSFLVVTDPLGKKRKADFCIYIQGKELPGFIPPHQ